MRVFVDTNLFIAYLLKPRDDSFINLLLNALIEGQVTVLMPEALLGEIENTVKRKPHLIRMITENRLQRFLVSLRSLCEVIPVVTEPIPPITRDPNDDYLIAYAVIGKADYLVSGDKDLLVLERVGRVAVVDSGQFRQVLAGL